MKTLGQSHLKDCLNAVAMPVRIGSALCLAVMILFATGLTAEARQHHRSTATSSNAYTGAAATGHSHLKHSARHHSKHAVQSKHHTHRHHRTTAHHHAHGSR